MGRNTKANPKTQAKILQAIMDGGSRRLAAALVGIGNTSIQRWADKDAQFRDALRRAEAECEMHHIKRISGGVPQWQSSAWFLERKWYKRWSLKKSVEGSENRDKAIAESNQAAIRASISRHPTSIAGEPSPVQDSPSGPTVGKNGTGQTPTGQ